MSINHFSLLFISLVSFSFDLLEPNRGFRKADPDFQQREALTSVYTLVLLPSSFQMLFHPFTFFMLFNSQSIDIWFISFLLWLSLFPSPSPLSSLFCPLGASIAFSLLSVSITISPLSLACKPHSSSSGFYYFRFFLSPSLWLSVNLYLYLFLESESALFLVWLVLF